MSVRTTPVAALFVTAALFSAPAFAGTFYWYNGSPDLNNDLINENGFSGGSALVYDDFVVGAGGVDVTGVLANDSLSSVTGINTATWQIRSGVSAGNGGTLIASGDSTATLTDTGQFLGGEIYTVEVDGLDIDLSAGTYWLAVTPDITNSQTSYVDTTSGAGGVGSPQAQDGDSFINSPLLGANFLPSSTLSGTDRGDGGKLDYSLGILTTSATPEPSTLFMTLGAALMGFAGLRRRRSR